MTKLKTTIQTLALVALCGYQLACSPVRFNIRGNDSGTNATQNPVPPTTENPTATAPIYMQTSGSLYTLDLSSRQAKLIGNLQVGNNYAPSITDIAISLSGKMYAVASYYSNGVPAYDIVYLVNPQTAQMTELLHLPAAAGAVTGSTMLDDSHLLVAANGLWITDIATSSSIQIPGTAGLQSAGDVIYLPDGNVYWAVTQNNSLSNCVLYRVDPRSGGATFIGNFAKNNVFGLGYVNGRLIGFADDGSIFDINPSNAVISNIFNPAKGGWFGAATNPLYW